MTVWITVDGQVSGVILLRDAVRGDAGRTLRRLRAAGIERIVMLTGDRAEVAETVAGVLGIDRVLAEQTPAAKVERVREEARRATTMMVGDGINDAPALAAADIGVAMGARGAAASAQVADVVLTADRLDRLADAMDVARRTRRIAVQSAGAGMALSLLAMAVAAAGALPPSAGAVLQEAIDVTVILNALRALRPIRGPGCPSTGRHPSCCAVSSENTPICAGRSNASVTWPTAWAGATPAKRWRTSVTSTRS